MKLPWYFYRNFKIQQRINQQQVQKNLPLDSVSKRGRLFNLSFHSVFYEVSRKSVDMYPKLLLNKISHEKQTETFLNVLSLFAEKSSERYRLGWHILEISYITVIKYLRGYGWGTWSRDWEFWFTNFHRCDFYISQLAQSVLTGENSVEQCPEQLIGPATNCIFQNDARCQNETCDAWGFITHIVWGKARHPSSGESNGDESPHWTVVWTYI